jgi:hypothetical protein
MSKVMLSWTDWGDHTEKFLQDWQERNIDVVFLVPHSSDPTQLLKQGCSSSNFGRLATAPSNDLLRIVGA